MTKIRMPFNGKFKMTQEFGAPFSFRGKKVIHQGVDWALPGDTPVVACFDGIVSRLEKWRLSGYGRSIYLRSSDGKFTALYAHLNRIDVDLNSKIKVGTVIGVSGATGYCRSAHGGKGYHLHFGLKNNYTNKYIDSLPYFVLPGRLELPPVESITDGYIVKKGDSLWSIAKAFYGDGNKWEDIHLANKDKIKNPDLIFPGQVLKIPGLR